MSARAALQAAAQQLAADLSVAFERHANAIADALELDQQAPTTRSARRPRRVAVREPKKRPVTELERAAGRKAAREMGLSIPEEG